MKVFGFEISRSASPADNAPPSFVVDPKDDGALVIASGGAWGTSIDLDGTMRSESELITRYREMTYTSDIDIAIEEILNESITQKKGTPVIEINLDDLDIDEKIKKVIIAEFHRILELLEFSEYCYDIFRNWYVDGRLVYNIVIDPKHRELGILKLKYIDPRKIKKVREVKRKILAGTSVAMPVSSAEYFVYNEKGFTNVGNIGNPTINNAAGGLRIAKDSISFTPSGLVNSNRSMVLSYLHKAIKPLNMLRAIEDATIIYRLSRAPERRIFYVEVGDLPKNKAEQHLKDMMIKHKNRLVYNSEDGSVRDDRKFATMQEDYWIPVRGGNSGTKIDTLQGLQNVDNLDDLNYFRDKVSKSLNVPFSRIEPDQSNIFGRANEVTRDEIRFFKFVEKLRKKFNHLFLGLLEKQLVLKNILNTNDWEAIKQKISFDYAKDNHFEELKSLDIERSRLELLGQIMSIPNVAGRYYSHTYLRKNILQQSDEDIEQMDGEIAQEMNNPIYAPLYAPEWAAQQSQEEQMANQKKNK